MDEEVALKCNVCGEAAAQRCGACRNVAYCNREHQKKDWKTHKLLCKPPPFEVECNDELGRHLVATRDLQAGEVIVSEAPLVAGPKQVSAPLCLGCHAARPRARCSRCLWPLCSLSCTHPAAECAALSVACAPLEFGDDDEPHYAYEAITVLRCVLLQKMNPRRWRLLSSMEAHENKRKGTEIYKENQIRVVGFLRNFVGLGGWDEKIWDTSEKTLHRLTGILDVNALEIRLTEATELQALYATASLLEHSCVPNVRLVFDDSLRLSVSASVAIPKGAHIKTMYTHALWGTQARRQHLLDNKYFLCHCERCADPTELATMFSALRCVGGCEEAYLLPKEPLNAESDWTCNGGCGSTLTAAHASELVLRLADEVEHVLSRGDVPSLEVLLSRLERLTHPNHYHQFAVKHSLLQQLARNPSASSESEEVRKKAMCERLLAVTQTLDPGAARLAAYEGVLCVELHSVRLQLARRRDDAEHHRTETQAARDLLQRAVHILRFEPKHLPEGKLAIIAQTSLAELNSRLEQICK
ncbi:hypothetical protein B566_EDAN008547 [Ephemera danica]|nr:hypothetical protein B566_EDAN008547 [Ephemera danica]